MVRKLEEKSQFLRVPSCYYELIKQISEIMNVKLHGDQYIMNIIGTSLSLLV
jgi:hypothetical protein